MGRSTRKHPKRVATLFIGAAAAVALAGAVAFMAVRAPVPGSPGVAGPPSAVSSEGLSPAPDIEVVMYQGETAVGGSRVRLSQLWGKGKPVEPHPSRPPTGA